MADSWNRIAEAKFLVLSRGQSFVFDDMDQGLEVSEMNCMPSAGEALNWIQVGSTILSLLIMIGSILLGAWSMDKLRETREEDSELDLKIKRFRDEQSRKFSELYERIEKGYD